MTRLRTVAGVALFLLIATIVAPAFAVPPITGIPTIDAPPLLEWPRDKDNGLPDLTEATANRVTDLHASISECGFVLSTAGNYHMALRDLWFDHFLPSVGDLNIKSWFYNTSPPIAVEQIKNNSLTFGNVSILCRPQVAVGNQAHINALKAAGCTEGTQVSVFRNWGNVILVKKGNPKHIESVWDLARPNVRVVTPHPALESNTFTNYSGSIYDIAAADKSVPTGWTADRLFNSIFNNATIKDKWLTGGRIHHREVPWSIAYGKADAGVLFYHLALDAVRKFPDLFEIVPLGGTAGDPDPLAGNKIGAHFAIRIRGDWTTDQLVARERLMILIGSDEFTTILENHGMRR